MRATESPAGKCREKKIRLFTESDDLICFLHHILISSYASILRRFGGFLFDFLAKSHASLHMQQSLAESGFPHYICRIPLPKSGFLHTNK